MSLRIYLNEYNVLMDNAIYLPYASGLLRAYVEKFTNEYKFQPFIYESESIDKIIGKYIEPDIACFSVSMWNEQLSLKVAGIIKELYPKCKIIFGGCQVRKDYKYPIIMGSGEEKFLSMLGIDNPKIENLDDIPSPYLLGYYDYLLEENPTIDFQAIIETNRGCPFSCSYCYWGKGDKTYKFHSLERIKKEIEWCGKNRIKYVFNADSNFGIHERDLEISQMLVDTKKQYGYPEKFRSCFTKNAEERIFSIGKLLHSNDMEKGITLSFQSLNETALRNINRNNIKLSVYENLIKRFDAEGIPTYTELILGLPGETLDTWRNALSKITNKLFIYFCEVYPNTQLAEPSYQENFEIKTKRIKLTPTHSIAKETGEFQDIVISTYSMNVNQWRSMWIHSWLTMTLKLASPYIDDMPLFFKYLDMEIPYYENHLDSILNGNGRCVKLEQFGNIWWDMEEASFLRIMDKMMTIKDKPDFAKKTILYGRKSNIKKETIDYVLRS